MANRRNIAPAKGGGSGGGSKEKFAAATFERMAADLQSGRTPLVRIAVTDPEVIGLRAIIRKTGLISYHVSYSIEGSRPLLKIGDHMPGKPGHTTVEEARKIARTVIALGDRGIDVQEGLHTKLMRELLEKGEKWRP